MAKNEIKIAIVGDAKSATKALGDTAKATQGLQKQMSGFAQAAAGAFGAQKVIGFAKQSIKAAGDVGEAVNKSRELFGTASIAVEKFAETAARDLGQSRLAALDAAGTFAVFGKAAGKSGQELATFSTEMVTLASDLASFHNTRPEEAVYALGAALRGEYEPARRFGYQLSVMEIGTKAVEMGLTDNARALDAHSKTLAAQALLMEGAGDAVGDFARTSDSATNAQRILAAQMEEVKISLGEALMPAFTAVLNVVGPLLDAWNSLDPVIKNIIGTFAVLSSGLLTATVALSGLKAALGAIGLAGAAATPYLLAAAAAVTAVSVAYGVFTGNSQKAKAISDSLSMAIRQTTEELASEKGLLDELIAELEGADAASATLFQTFKNDGVRNSENLIDAMGDLGLSYEDLFTGISRGEEGLRSYLTELARQNGATDEVARSMADLVVEHDNIEGTLSLATGATFDFMDANKGLVRALGEVADAEDWYADLANGSFRREFERSELLEENNQKLWESAAATVQMGNVTGEATTWMDVYNEYLRQQGIAADVAAQMEARRATAQDDVTDSAMSQQEILSALNEEVAQAQSVYQAAVDAANAWADGVRDAVNRGSQSFIDTSEVQKQTASQFIDSMREQTTAAQDWEADLETVQNNMVSGTDQQKADFIGYLAEMGAAGAPMVDDLSKNTDLIQPMFDAWVKQTETTSDGMIGGLDPVAAGLEDQMHKADLRLRSSIAVAKWHAKSRARELGESIPEGAASGVASGTGDLVAQINSMVDQALSAAETRAEKGSPSELFAREVGVPIAQGVEEGVIREGESISRAIVSAIDAAARDAVAAAQKLVDDASAVLSDLWGGIDKGRTEEDLIERISDAERAQAEAAARVVEAQKELEGERKGTDEYAKAQKNVEAALEAADDAAESLKDAHYALAKATIENVSGTQAQVEAWMDTAAAAGLNTQQIRGLIQAYRDLQSIQADSELSKTATSSLADRAKLVNSDFSVAVRQGWVEDDVLQHIVGLGNPSDQMSAMIDRLNKIQRFFGWEVKSYASGTRFHPGGLAIVGEQGPELVSMPRGSQVFSNGSFGGTINLTVNAGIGTDGVQLGRYLYDVLDKYQRAGGRR